MLMFAFLPPPLALLPLGLLLLLRLLLILRFLLYLSPAHQPGHIISNSNNVASASTSGSVSQACRSAVRNEA